MIGRPSIRLEEHLIVELCVLEHDLSLDDIVDGRGLTARHQHANDVWLVGIELLLNLLASESPTASIVRGSRGATRLGCFGTKLLEALGTAEASIRVTTLSQPRNHVRSLAPDGSIERFNAHWSNQVAG